MKNLSTALLICWATLASSTIALSFSSSKNLISQLTEKETITGSVTSAHTKLPLAGVTVNLKGSSETTITDSNGNFSLTIDKSPKSTIIFSYEKHEQLAVKVGNQSAIAVSLSEAKLVTTALGIKRKAESLSYSLTEIKGDELTNVVQENFLNSLAGRVAGLSVSQTSGIGSSVNVVLRGFKSLSNDNQPLYVVDGVPMLSPLNNVAMRGNRNDVDYGSVIAAINPEDIASVAILRGPTSAALYGARGNNGVIQITTKTGQKGLNVNFSTSNVIETPYRFLDYHYKLANGSRPDQFDQASGYWVGPELDKGIMAVQWNSPLDENGNPIATELKSYKNNVKNFVQPAITTLNNLSVAGGSDKVSYRAGINMMRNQGLIPGSDLYRNGITAAVQYQPVKSIKISTNLNFIGNGSGSAPSTGNRGANPLEAAYAYSYVDVRELKDYWLTGQEQIKQRSPNPNIDNPYFLAKGINNSYQRDHYFGNVRIDWQILPSLSIYARVMHNRHSEKRETKIPWSYARSASGGYYLDDFGTKETNIESMVSYRRKIKDVFEITVSGGGNFMSQSNNESLDGGSVLTKSGVFTIDNIPISSRAGSTSTYRSEIGSLIGLLSFSYKNEVYLDVTARNDWSTILRMDDRSRLYPSAGLTWIANRTFKMPDIIALLKLRASFVKDQMKDPASGANWTIIAPDKNTSAEYGLEVGFLQNRVRLEGTYSTFQTKSLFYESQAPSSGYFPTFIPIQFSGNTIELTLNTTPLYNKNGWNIDAALAFSRSVSHLGETPYTSFIPLWEDNGGGSRTFIGDKIGNLYSRGYQKVTDTSSPYYQWPILSPDGELIPDNALGSREKLGNIFPNFILGSQLAISYKKFNLTANFDWRSGGKFMSNTYRYAGSESKSSRQLTTFPGGNYSTEELVAMLKSNPGEYIIPRQGNFPLVGGYSKETGGFQHSYYDQYDGVFIPGVRLNPDGSYSENLGANDTKFIPIAAAYPWSFNKAVTFDADFIKLREIALSYTAKIGKIKNAQFSIYSRNILLWTKAKIGIDPERAYQNTSGAFRQGIESQNINPWTIPIGFKIGVTI